MNPDSSVYYQDSYWNDLEEVAGWLNAKISGDAARSWSRHFADRHGRQFQRAFVLNCGNGWVERLLMEEGLIAEAVGIDYSEQFVEQSQAAASELDLPLRYLRMDVNDGSFPAGEFDLVVNFAAAHHVARLDRVFRALCEMLPEDGVFVSYDYVGPHRNQYRDDAWEAAWAMNRDLPERFRQELHYPHLPTMLAGDPTEAIHSELVLEVFRRYFIVDEYVPLGGAIAYPLLTHNEGLFAAGASEDRSLWIERVLRADEAFTAAQPDATLFAYFSGRPNKAVLQRTEDLEVWARDEEARESAAAADGGEYYPHTALQHLVLSSETQRVAAEHARAWALDLRAELDTVYVELAAVRTELDAVRAELHAVRSSALYRMSRRLVTNRAVRAIRSSRVGCRLERAARNRNAD